MIFDGRLIHQEYHHLPRLLLDEAGGCEGGRLANSTWWRVSLIPVSWHCGQWTASSSSPALHTSQRQLETKSCKKWLCGSRGVQGKNDTIPKPILSAGTVWQYLAASSRSHTHQSLGAFIKTNNKTKIFIFIIGLMSTCKSKISKKCGQWAIRKQFT